MRGGGGRLKDRTEKLVSVGGFMRTLSLCLLAASTIAAPACAAPLAFKPLVDARLRYETVDQDGIAANADALTARLRVGAEVKGGPFALLVESEATLAISEKYNSGINGKAGYPIVADPENIELNRAQIQFTGLPRTIVTLGRQRINLDDQRFVGWSAGATISRLSMPCASNGRCEEPEGQRYLRLVGSDHLGHRRRRHSPAGGLGRQCLRQPVGSRRTNSAC